MMKKDTIAAVSTPRGKGGIAVIRVSGPDALLVAGKVFFPKDQKKTEEMESRKMTVGDICGCDECGERTFIDDGMAVVFRAPHSFTGEDVVEINCHGGILVTQMVLSALLAAGARMAEAGEFTRRAYINGKISLSAAEALGDLLEAKTQAQVHLSRNGMRGLLDAEGMKLYNRLSLLLASVYAVIDYPDEDLTDITRAEMVVTVEETLARTRALAATYRTGHAIAEGISTVICGKANVGKSSLYNRIVGRDAAIVTDIAGTTRDLLTDTATLGQVTLRLSDTAGLRESSDCVEQIGIARARAEMEKAELILALFDGSTEIDNDDRELLEILKKQNAPVIAVVNKSDKADVIDLSTVRDSVKNVVRLSAATGEGFPSLVEAVEALFLDGELDVGEDVIVTAARQQAALVSAADALQTALAVLTGGVMLDVCAAQVECAMCALAEMDGRAVSEDIVAGIFSHFCVGK